MIAVTIALALGYVMGLIHKGIHIHVDKHPEKPKEYNESLANMLPPDVQEYYSSNRGQNNWK